MSLVLSLSYALRVEPGNTTMFSEM